MSILQPPGRALEVKRRRVVVAAGCAAAAAALRALAQPAAKVHRIGVLSEIVPRQFLPLLGMLPALGYEEGRNLVIDYKFAQGQPALLPQLAAELVAGKPDLIVAVTNTEAAVLKRVTTTIPILMVFAAAPVETGLVASLARPGGNVTGTTVNAPETVGKMTQVLRETIPHMSRIAWLVEPDHPGMALYIRSAERAAAAMKLRLVTLTARTSSDIDAALATLGRERPDALGVATSGIILSNAPRITEFVARHKIPALYTTNVPVLGAGLMSYAADTAEIARRSAWMLDKILKGAKPSDIPVEEPAKFTLTINMKTARSMGLTIPRSVLMQADEVIE